MRLKESLVISFYIIAAIWLVFLVSCISPADLKGFGIKPRQTSGLMGIMLFPFLHANLSHIISNTCALMTLLPLTFMLGKGLAAEACAIILVTSGGLVWIFGQPGTVHIGASGMVFGLMGFLIFAGPLHGKPWLMILSIAMVFVYGGSIFINLFNFAPGISWAGHFFGLMSGVFAAWMTKPEAS
ncbi:MAG: rhomboid family intramembrane serine protease [Syntrophobacteraceae bacterium]|nr:rhomboid family intramembrane serine protease [Desulfobacteraceae bacterium]